MKKFTIVLLLITLLFTGCTSDINTDSSTNSAPIDPQKKAAIQALESEIANAPTYRTEPQDSHEQTALDFIDLFFTDNYAATLTTFQFSDELRQVLTAEQLSNFRAVLSTSFGSFENVFDISSEIQDNLHVVKLNSHFKGPRITLIVTLNDDNFIMGFTTDQYINASVAKINDSIAEKYITFGDPNFILEGTMTMPVKEKNKAVVILVPGAGLSDKDESYGPNKPYKDIAYELANMGIATFRYDKRTLTYQSSLSKDTTLTFEEESIKDVTSAIQYLKEETGLDTEHIFVLGHNLSGYFLPQIDAETDAIDGLIFMNAFNQPLSQIAQEQLKYAYAIDGSINADEQVAIDSMGIDAAQLEPNALSKLSEDSQVLEYYKSYWVSLNQYDPNSLLKASDTPMLFTRGLNDTLVSASDFENWKSAINKDQDATFLTFEGLNHLMMPTITDNTSTDWTENQIDSSYTTQVGQWILSKLQ